MTIIEDVTIEGDESQNVIGNTVGRDLVVQVIKNVRGRPSMILSEAQIAERVAVYVPALNHDRIAAVLARDNVIALCGPEGDGMTTTAIAVLRHVRPGIRIQSFSAGEDDVGEVAAKTEAYGYLVRAHDEDPWRLRSFLEAVRMSDGFAIVIGTAAEQRRFAGFQATIEVEAPPAEAVYLSHLARRGLGESGWPHWQRGLELLKSASPGDASRLAELVEIISREGGDTLDVEHAYLGWAEELRTWFSDHSELLDQTLMIAAATIEPADETQVYAAALSLARHLEIKPPGGGLAWTPTTGLCVLLATWRDNERIVFRRHGYAESVLPHVCTEYPLARMELLSWLSDLPTDKVLALEPTLGHRLVEKFAELAAGYNAHEKITQMAHLWAGGTRSDLAYIALAETCLHPVVGGRVRQKLYEWSTQSQTSQTLKLTIARVCQVLGETYLPIALTRLQHLATHGNKQVRDEVFEVARSLAELDPGAVFTTALHWARTSVNRSYNDAVRRLDIATRLLLDLLPLFGATELHAILQTIDLLVTNGNSRLRPHLLAWAKALAAEHRGAVLNQALTLAAGGDGRMATTNARSTFGTRLFLSLVLTRDSDGLPSVLNTTPRINPLTCTAPWRIALSSPGDFPDLNEALSLWLNTAAVREELRQPLVSALVTAASNDPRNRQRLTDMVRTWDAGIRDHRPVKETILTRILLPDRHRWALIAWVRLRTALAPRL
ncbi:hypothetical protein ACOZ38_38170 [Sphaerisporangium viridialbum]|uniref:hypothetical protein n=1 Tax=Sphaerisporangium viridialbum TaxID=46189 RepID=UPI003C727EFB